MENHNVPFDAQVTAHLDHQNYKTILSAQNKTLIGDEPENLGGQDLGFNPYELLSSSLAMCTAATLRMYTERKGIDLGKIDVEVRLKNDTVAQQVFFTKHISFEKKDIAEDLMKRLLAVADACPVNKLLKREIVITSVFVDE